MGLIVCCHRNAEKVAQERQFSGLDREFHKLVPPIGNGVVVAKLFVEVVSLSLSERFDAVAAGDPYTWLLLGEQLFRTRTHTAFWQNEHVAVNQLFAFDVHENTPVLRLVTCDEDYTIHITCKCGLGLCIPGKETWTKKYDINHDDAISTARVFLDDLPVSTWVHRTYRAGAAELRLRLRYEPRGVARCITPTARKAAARLKKASDRNKRAQRAAAPATTGPAAAAASASNKASKRVSKKIVATTSATALRQPPDSTKARPAPAAVPLVVKPACRGASDVVTAAALRGMLLADAFGLGRREEDRHPETLEFDGELVGSASFRRKVEFWSSFSQQRNYRCEACCAVDSASTKGRPRGDRQCCWLPLQLADTSWATLPGWRTRFAPYDPAHVNDDGTSDDESGLTVDWHLIGGKTPMKKKKKKPQQQTVVVLTERPKHDFGRVPGHPEIGGAAAAGGGGVTFHAAAAIADAGTHADAKPAAAGAKKKNNMTFHAAGAIADVGTKAPPVVKKHAAAGGHVTFHAAAAIADAGTHAGHAGNASCEQTQRSSRPRPRRQSGGGLRLNKHTHGKRRIHQQRQLLQACDQAAPSPGSSGVGSPETAAANNTHSPATASKFGAAPFHTGAGGNREGIAGRYFEGWSGGKGFGQMFL